MNESAPGSDFPFSSLPSFSDHYGGSQPGSELRRLWGKGRSITVEEYLAEHPEYASAKSVILDLVYEEWNIRLQAGEMPDPRAFAARFERYGISVTRLLMVHEFVDDRPHLAVHDWPKIGQSIAGFDFVCELGSGAFARVYLARQPELGNRLVALKVSPSGAEEARTLGRLSHPNIIQVYSAVRNPESELTLVCMPYLGGATLDKVRKQLRGRGSLPTHAGAVLKAIRQTHADGLPDAAGEEPVAPVLRRGTYVDGVCHLAAQLADALACIHSQGVCHRDLKPSNILLTAQGRPVLLDFNLSHDPAREQNTVGGTLPYMAPEQLRALLSSPEPEDAPQDVRADVYSLGVLVYELLAGCHPFSPFSEGNGFQNLGEELLLRQQQPVVALGQRNPAVNASLARLVEQCLRPDPEDRPSATDLAAGFRRSLTPRRRLIRWVRVHPWWTAVAAALLVGAIVSGTVRFADRQPVGQREYQAGVRTFRAGQYTEALAHFTRAVEAEPGSAQGHFARGRTNQALGLLLQADADYRQADELAPSGRTKACRAYCQGLLGSHPTALELNSQAIKEGFAPIAVLNNRAFCRMRQLGPLDEARADLEEALRRDPPSYEVLQNRAGLELEYAGRYGRGRYVPERGIRVLYQAFDRGVKNLILESWAARLCSLASSGEAHRGEDAVQLARALGDVRCIPLAWYWWAEARKDFLASERWADEAEEWLRKLNNSGRGPYWQHEDYLFYRIYVRHGPIPMPPASAPQPVEPPLIDPVSGLGD